MNTKKQSQVKLNRYPLISLYRINKMIMNGQIRVIVNRNRISIINRNKNIVIQLYRKNNRFRINKINNHLRN